MTTGKIDKIHESQYEVQVDWKIENFADVCRRGFRALYPFTSPLFTWSSINWDLRMAFDNPHIKLFVRKHASVIEVPVMYEFGIRSADGALKLRCSFLKFFKHPEYRFRRMHLTELFTREHELQPNGVLTISCTVYRQDSSTKPQNLKYESMDVLSSNLKALFDCNKNSDITINVHGQNFPAHKAILAARSDVFAAMLQNDMKEKNTSIISISDCDSTSFKDFLLFLYTGNIEISPSSACHLYKIADKYNVQDLKSACLKYMGRNIHVTNFFDIVTTANQFNETELISMTQKFFYKNKLEIVSGDDWEQFIKQCFPVANELLITMMGKG